MSTISRRILLRGTALLAAVGASGGLIAACGSQPAAQPSQGGAAAPVATTVPKAPATQASVATSASAPTTAAQPTAAPTAAPKANAAPAGEKVALSIVPGFNPGNAKVYWQNMQKEFQQRFPNVAVTMNFQPDWNAETTVIKASIASGDVPDVVMTQDNFSYQLVVDNALMPLDDLWKVDQTFDVKNFAKGLVDQVTKEGKVYGVPIYSVTMWWVYRTDLFQKNNVTAPKTREDLLKAAQALKETGIKFPLALSGDMSEWAGIGYFWNFGTSVVSVDGQKSQLMTKEFQQAVKWTWDMINTAKLIDPGVVTGGITAQAIKASFVKGDYTMLTDGPWDIASNRANKDMQGKWAGMPRALSPEGAQRHEVVGGTHEDIPKGAKHPTEAWNFISLSLSADMQKTIPSIGDVPSNFSVTLDKDLMGKYPDVLPAVEAMMPPTITHARLPYTWVPDAGNAAWTAVQKALQKPSWDAAVKELDAGDKNVQTVIDQGKKR